MTPEQAITLLRDIVQERVNQMGPALQSVVGPAAQGAFNVINETIKKSELPAPEYDSTPSIT